MPALPPSSPPRVAVVAFDRISPFHLAVPAVVFGDPHPDVPRFPFVVCAVEPGRLASTTGFALIVEPGLAALAEADIIIVPSWRDPEESPPPALLAELRRAHRRGAILVGLCLGAYVLAATGLLDGQRATTHWAYAADFARRFPQVEVDADVLYRDEGQLLTSAGTAAGIDCCLHLLRRLYGAEVANRVARRLVVPPHRQGGQAQFVAQPVPAQRGDERLAGLLDWLRARLDQPHTLDSLAAQTLLSRRSLTRHFRQLTGLSVQDWLLAERLALAQRLLEGSELSIEQIGAQSGFGSPAAFRLHFRRAFGVSPRDWRQSFRGGAVL